MTISLYSYLNALLWSLLLLLCIRIFRKKYTLTTGYESRILMILYLACMVRLLFPVDVVFSIGINLSGFYSVLFRYLILNKIHMVFFKCSIFELLCVLFSLVALIKIVIFITEYLHTKRLFNACLPYDHPDLALIHQRMYRYYPKIPNVRILQSPVLPTPVAIGIFQKIIVLPLKNFSSEELFYILLHEYSHFIRYDLVIKLFFNLFSCMFWWFPFISFSRKDLSHTIEIECDLQSIRNLNDSEQLSYVSTLLSVLTEQNSKKPAPYTASFALRESDINLFERFHMIFHYSKIPKNTFKNIMLPVFFSICFLFSYLFAPIPSYTPSTAEIEAEGAVSITPKNTYLIQKNKTYYIFFKNSNPVWISQEQAEQMLNNGFVLKETGLPSD